MSEHLSVGEKIKTLRNGRFMTQAELADKMGVTRCTISNYECNRRTPHLSELKRFADYFGVSLDYFGVATKDEIFDLISRAREVFKSDAVPKERKEEVYKELMKLYLELERE